MCLFAIVILIQKIIHSKLVYILLIVPINILLYYIFTKLEVS